MEDFHDLYLKTDVFLRADVYGEDKNMCLEYYGFDPDQKLKLLHSRQYKNMQYKSINHHGQHKLIICLIYNQLQTKKFKMSFRFVIVKLANQSFKCFLTKNY